MIGCKFGGLDGDCELTDLHTVYFTSLQLKLKNDGSLSKKKHAAYLRHLH